MSGSKLRLLAAALLFVGWLAYLGYAALSKERGPSVSRAQAAAAKLAVIASVNGGDTPGSTVTVNESLTANGPATGTVLVVVNLPSAAGWTGVGEYLLLLEPDADNYRVVGQQSSPGYPIRGVGKPVIYRHSADVLAQVKKMLP